GDEPPLIRRPAHGTRPAEDVPADVLAGTLSELALRVVDRFDARNGTGRQGELVRQLMTLPSTGDYVPRAATAGAPVTVPAPVVPVPDVVAVEPVEVPGSAGPDELLDLADDCYAEDQVERAEAIWRAFAERYRDEDLTAGQRARHLDAQGLLA